MQCHVNLEDAKTIIEAINAIRRELLIYAPTVTGLNSFTDDMRSFAGSSQLWSQELKKNPRLNDLHLVITNSQKFKNLDRKGYEDFINCLDYLRDQKNRYDSVRFSYEIRDSISER
jgi:hypothetical protein